MLLRRFFFVFFLCFSVAAIFAQEQTTPEQRRDERLKKFPVNPEAREAILLIGLPLVSGQLDVRNVVVE